MDNVDVNDRVRAWVLTQVDDEWQVIANQIKALDTKSPDLVGMMAGTRVEVLQVIDHDPKPPHLADGFITPAEVDADPRSATEFVKIGRQRNSPGENPWG
jgi:hypothetical protein